MKVMIVANSKTVKGGITSVVNSLTEGLAERNSTIKMSRHASYISSVPPFMRVVYSLAAMFKFLFVLQQYQLFHLHSAAAGSFYRKSLYTMLCKAFNKKVIFHIHGSSFEAFHNRNRFNAWLIIKTLNKADGIIVLSEQMKGLVESYCRNSNIWILPNPITIPDETEIKNLQKASDKVELLFMGEIGQRKGIYDLVTAISTLPDEIKEKIVLHVCGNNEIDKLKEFVKDKHLTDTCIVHGWIDGQQKKAFLANADIYVLPSYHEGLPVSILEAMAYTLPIISTNVGGIPEVVLENQNGFIITPGAIEQLAGSIVKLVENEELRANFGNKSKNMVSAHDIRKVSEQLLKIYEQMLGQVGKA